MARANNFIKMEIHMKVMSCMVRNSVKEHIDFLMEKFISDLSTIIKPMAKEKSFIQTPHTIKEIGNLENSMDLVNLYGQMVKYIRESI
jgi:hypothetical protein